jgi:hypothetical protein
MCPSWLRTIGNFVRPVMDLATRMRYHRSLRRLTQVIEQRESDSCVGKVRHNPTPGAAS